MGGRNLDVYLDGTFCGNLTQSTSGNVTFAYDEQYRASRGATPLSLAMPLAISQHRKRVVLPWLQGLLPDNDDALAAIARRYGVSAKNPFALLEQVGRDAAGAVQIVPEGAFATDSGSTASMREASADELSTMLSRVVAEYTEGAAYSADAGRFSLAGAQPKIALCQTDDGQWAIPEGSAPTTHIIKPVAGTMRGIDVIEQLTMRAAARLGNDVARTEVSTIGAWDVLISERYDRRRERGRWRRLHQEDLCQALSVAPDKKYQHLHGGPGIAQVASLLRSLPIAAERDAAGEAFYRAFVFNVVAGCTDAHAKNYSLMLQGRSAQMAPLYDLLTYAAYWDGTSRLESAMSVGSEYVLDRITPQALVASGRQFGVSADAAGDIVETVRQEVLGAFDAAREELVALVPSARAMGDAVVDGVAKLPLVAR